MNEDTEAGDKLAELLNEFEDVFTEGPGFVEYPEDEWMRIREHKAKIWSAMAEEESGTNNTIWGIFSRTSRWGSHKAPEGTARRIDTEAGKDPPLEESFPALVWILRVYYAFVWLTSQLDHLNTSQTVAGGTSSLAVRHTQLSSA
ncbi:hypothetical protein EMCG_09072 [[Emmonsia] crescens]|uniref:Uncharacterized protein n=1 Tax=[Emmonsia] crescens TaxID=73230 RepID=A0A0G2I304_9EURO|nr:hypothetical protein EMCG_09072 [Emmonsia crescens UAMH 3008]